MPSRFLLVHLPGLAMGLAPSHGEKASSALQPPSCSSSCDVNRALQLMLAASGCPKVDAMYEQMAALESAQGRFRSHTFMSVGCNRATDLIAFSQRFDATGAYDHDAWLSSMQASYGSVPGVYCPTQSPVMATYRPSELKPRAFCIEAMPSNGNLVSTTLRAQPALNGALTVVGKAFGSSSEVGTTVQFQDCPAGEENHGIGTTYFDGDPAACTVANVTMDSVDAFSPFHGITTLDALFVDTEGHDPAVLEGASQMIAKGNVRYIEFEVHNDILGTVWSHTKLRQVTAPLEAAGFSCYWMGSGSLTRLTGCHLEVYDTATLTFSNVACVRSADPWFHVVDAMSRGGLCETWGSL